MKQIDLNADLGEANRPDGLAIEARMTRYVSSANIACGGHAGDENSMRVMARAARKNGTVIGAHPAYPDRENFGRRSLHLGTDISRSELRRAIARQILDLVEIAADEAMEVRYVKPHGALYNDAVFNRELAELIAQLVARIDPDLYFMGAPNSEMHAAAETAGLNFVSEGFIDRRYTDDGHLLSRKEAGAVLQTQAERLAQLSQIVSDGKVETQSGALLNLNVQTLCLHGDSDGAFDTAKAVRRVLETAGIEVRSFAHG